jgi:hypothetical protein
VAKSSELNGIGTADMDDIQLEQWTEKSNVLRTELKAWEKEFACGNDGRKAGREDIKKHPDIGMCVNYD